MKVIKINKIMLLLRQFSILLIFFFLFLGWIHFDKKETNFGWLIGAISALITWNILRYAMPSYKVIDAIQLDNSIVTIDNKRIIDLNKENEIVFYKNGFKGESFQYNFLALNHFMAKDGINKIRIKSLDQKFFDLFILIESSSEMQLLEIWFDKLSVNKSTKKFKGFNI